MSTIIGLRAASQCQTGTSLLRISRPSLSRFKSQSNGRRTFFGIGEGITYASLALSKKVIWGTIGVNAAVFGAWQYAKAFNALPDRTGSGSGWRVWRNGRQQQRKVSTAEQVGTVLNDNFIMRGDDISKGKYWTTITSAFSHMEPYHIIGNMFTFHAFATVLTYSGLPPAALVTLMFGSAIASSVGHLAYDRSSGQNRMVDAGALGASGIVSGLGAAAALTRPFVNLQLFGIIPVPMFILFAGYTIYDSYYLDDRTSNVGHAAHLGGSCFGVLFWALFMRRLGGPLGV